MIWTWNLNPVAFNFIGLDIRWYGLVYVGGFFLTLWLGNKIQQNFLRKPLPKPDFENFIFGTFLCGIIGGRLGFFLFYQWHSLLQNPFELFQVWHGGMSIHGGVMGGLLFLWWWTRKHSVSALQLMDILTLPLAITLIFGRLANFVNGELIGRPTGESWGVIFPFVDQQLRHPSQLYESGKNFFLSLILLALITRGYGKKPGMLTTVFLIGYGVLRFFIEYVREPDGYIWILTTGQFLCLLMILFVFFLAFQQKLWKNA